MLLWGYGRIQALRRLDAPANLSSGTAAVASFFMHPSQVDPLNGYALLTVALMGCMGPVFTLFLLHTQNIKSLFSTVLCSASWVINSVVFVMLMGNLTRTLDTEAINRVLRNLAGSPFCGDSSALVLCQEWTGQNPLATLAGFYDQTKPPNKRTIPLVYGFSLAVFLAVVSLQVVEATRKYEQGRYTAYQKVLGAFEDRGPAFTYIGKLRLLCTSLGMRFTFLTLTTLLFILSLVYEYEMVQVYRKMDVIDLTGWTFGQVVAVMLWVPLLLEAINVEVLERMFGK